MKLTVTCQFRLFAFLVIALVNISLVQRAIAQVTVQDAQARAIQIYPDLGVKGTPLNLEFLAEYQRLRAMSPEYFQEPLWPLTLAKQCAEIINRTTTTPASDSTTATARGSANNQPQAQSPDSGDEPNDTGPVEAADLAMLYRRDPGSANTKYTGKKISIKGTVKEFDFKKATNAENSTVAITFETPVGAPAVTVDPMQLSGLIIKTNKESGQNFNDRDKLYEVKSVEGHVSVRSYWQNSYESQSSTGYNYKYSYKHFGEWRSSISVGDEITINGHCNGKTMDILITDGSF